MVRHMGRGRSLRPITSYKHYTQQTLSSLASGSVLTEIFANAVAIRTSGNEIVTSGSNIKNVFIERWIRGVADDNIFGLMVYKAPNGIGSISFADASNLNDWENKSNILFVTYGTLPTANPVPVIRQWIKNFKPRMALRDSLRISIWCQAGDLRICGFTTYKEYT